MSDILHIGQWGAEGSLAFGLNHASDNHGNRLSGFDLNCAGGPQIKLNLFDMDELVSNIDRAKGWVPIRFDGDFSVAHDRPSPLQTVCNDMRAQEHHTTLGEWAKWVVGL